MAAWNAIYDSAALRSHLAIGTAQAPKSVNRTAIYASFGGGAVPPPPASVTYWLNRGRTAAGVCVEWVSEGANVDLAGAFYVGPPVWGDIVEVVGLSTWIV